VFFDPTRAAFMAERRKRAGHLLSKHRFLAAQFAAILEDGRWLALARQANLMADRLSAKLAAVAWRRFGLWRQISCSSSCRVRSMPGSRPPVPDITCAQTRASSSVRIKSWRASSRPLPRRTMRSTVSRTCAKVSESDPVPPQQVSVPIPPTNAPQSPYRGRRQATAKRSARTTPERCALGRFAATNMRLQFAAAREAVVRKARMRSASAPVLIVGALASPLALLMSSVWVRLPCPITRAA